MIFTEELKVLPLINHMSRDNSGWRRGEGVRRSYDGEHKPIKDGERHIYGSSIGEACLSSPPSSKDRRRTILGDTNCPKRVSKKKRFATESKSD